MKIIQPQVIKYIQKNINFFIGSLLFIICIVLLSYFFSPSVIEGLSDNIYIRFYNINNFNPIYIIPSNSSQIITNLFTTNITGGKEMYNLSLNNTNSSYNFLISDSVNKTFVPINANITILNGFRDLYKYINDNNDSNQITKMITNISINYDSNTKPRHGTSRISFNYTFKDQTTGTISNVGSTIYMDNNIDQVILSLINKTHDYSKSIVTGIKIEYVYPLPSKPNAIMIYTSSNPTNGDQIMLDIDLFTFIKNIATQFINAKDDSNINSVYCSDTATTPLYSKNNTQLNNQFISGYIQDDTIKYHCILQIPTDQEVTNYNNAIAAAAKAIADAKTAAEAKAAQEAKAIADAKAADIIKANAKIAAEAEAKAAAAKVTDPSSKMVKYVKISKKNPGLSLVGVKVYSNINGNYQDIALNRKAEQSSGNYFQGFNRSKTYLYNADRAVQGNTIGDSVYPSMTMYNNFNPWWKVTLDGNGVPLTSIKIEIYNKTDYHREKLYGALVELQDNGGNTIISYVLEQKNIVKNTESNIEYFLKNLNNDYKPPPPPRVNKPISYDFWFYRM